jgi:23S rRNA (guanosine2251-2'-O)-methyltransferase
MTEMQDMIFGIRPVLEAMKAGKEINKILVQQGLHGDLYHELRQALRHRDALIQTVPAQKLARITRKNHQGVIAFLSMAEYHSLDQLIPQLYEDGQVPALMLLDRITDVRNFGAIARTAACMGVQGLIIPEKGAAQITADAVKTSAGALLNLPVCREKLLKQSIFFLQQSGIKVLAVTEKSDTPVWDADLTGPVAFILGSEEDGISPEYLKKADGTVGIPMADAVASMNVSVAAGMVLYELHRQRSHENS